MKTKTEEPKTPAITPNRPRKTPYARAQTARPTRPRSVLKDSESRKSITQRILEKEAEAARKKQEEEEAERARLQAEMEAAEAERLREEEEERLAIEELLLEAVDQTQHQRPDLQLTLVKGPPPKSQLEQFLEDEEKSATPSPESPPPEADEPLSIEQEIQQRVTPFLKFLDLLQHK